MNYKILGLSLLLATSTLAAFRFKGEIMNRLLYKSEAEATVGETLTELKNGESGTLFSGDYKLHLTQCYRLDNWKLKQTSIAEDSVHIQAIGTATNAFGASVNRDCIFVLKRKNNRWWIVDSYGFMANVEHVQKPGSDLTKARAL